MAAQKSGVMGKLRVNFAVFYPPRPSRITFSLYYVGSSRAVEELFGDVADLMSLLSLLPSPDSVPTKTFESEINWRLVLPVWQYPWMLSSTDDCNFAEEK